MIGILCNKKREKFIVRRLHALFRPLTRGNDMPIVVFTMQGLDLQDKVITGWMISCKKPSAVKTKLPAVIFNLAVQFSKSEIKNVRGLMESEDVSLFNLANRFNQLSIMEMLSSDNGVKNYVLPHADVNYKNFRDCFQGNENFIVKPLKGSNLLRINYWKKPDSVLKQNGKSAKDHRKELDFEKEVFRDIKTNSVLLLKTPDLMVNDGYLCVTRVYAERNFNGDWEVLPRSSMLQNECVCDNADNLLNKASIQIISHINQFIHDMFFCFVDFVMDMKGVPYLLNFGGWDSRILRGKLYRGIREKVCRNMLEYAQAFINRPAEGGNDVD